jgi:anti-sigma B factor antagonist
METISVHITEHPKDKTITLLSVKGQIDTLTAPEFEKKLLSALADKKFKLIIDLNGVDYISSAGWGIFIGEIKRIRSQKGDLVLVGMKTEVSEVFELLEFDSILKSFPNAETAAKAVFGN